MLNHVNFLVKDETSATAGESLGVAVLQIMEIALYVLLLYFATCSPIISLMYLETSYFTRY
jgi:hypothetical protein